MPVTRLAPSPTGHLHLGNARSFLVAWALARHEGWRVVLRIEDIDAARARPELLRDAEESLSWLGVDWDGPPLLQSTALPRHREAMRTLASRGFVFASPHSRSEVRAAASALHAPHEGEAVTRFPPELRPGPGEAWQFLDERVNYRFAARSGAEVVEDCLLGTHAFDLSQDPGDFLVWTKAGLPAYQLAVVVDDAAQGVTDVIRGDDLLPSAAQQQAIARALGLPLPRWWHLPLVRDEGGERLAKRRDATSLRALREGGTPPERVVGLIACWLGLRPRLEPMAAAELAQTVTPELLVAWTRREGPAGHRLLRSELDWLGPPASSAASGATP